MRVWSQCKNDSNTDRKFLTDIVFILLWLRSASFHTVILFMHECLVLHPCLIWKLFFCAANERVENLS